MRRTMTARQRLAVFANVSRIQSDQETYDMAVNRDVELKRQRVRAERAEAEREWLERCRKDGGGEQSWRDYGKAHE